MPIAWANKNAVSIKIKFQRYRIFLYLPSLMFGYGCLIVIYSMLVADFVNDKRLSHVPGPNAHNAPITDKT